MITEVLRSSCRVEAAGPDGAVTDPCPAWPTLLAWLENDLPDAESQLLNTHVADCDECREKLALMNAVQDVGDVGL